MIKCISTSYEYSLLKDTLVSSTYEEMYTNGNKTDIDKVYSYSLKSGNAEYLCRDVQQNVDYDNIKPEDIPLDIIREMTIGESPVVYSIGNNKDTAIETLKVNGSEFKVMVAAELNSKYVSYDEYKKCDDNKYIFKCQDKSEFKPGVLVNSLSNNNLYKGRLYYIYDEKDPHPALNWVDLEYDKIDTAYLKDPFAVSTYKNSLDNTIVKYKRDKFGFVEECDGVDYYCAKYMPEENNPDRIMTIRTIYPLKFIISLDGLLIAKDEFVFMVTELAEIDLSNNIVTYAKREIWYTNKNDYLDIIKSLKELDRDWK